MMPQTTTIDVIKEIEDGSTLLDALQKRMARPADFFDSLRHNPGLHDVYLEAVRNRAELYQSQIMAIADNEFEEVPRSKLKIDARKWAAEKDNPTRFGSKVEMTVSHKVDLRLAMEDADRRMIEGYQHVNPEVIEAEFSKTVEKEPDEPEEFSAAVADEDLLK